MLDDPVPQEVKAQAKAVYPFSHAAEPGENDKDHCRHCGYAIHTAIVHVWPLRGPDTNAGQPSGT